MVHAAIANPNNARNSFFCKNRGASPVSSRLSHLSVPSFASPRRTNTPACRLALRISVEIGFSENARQLHTQFPQRLLPQTQGYHNSRMKGMREAPYSFLLLSMYLYGFHTSAQMHVSFIPTSLKRQPALLPPPAISPRHNVITSTTDNVAMEGRSNLRCCNHH